MIQHATKQHQENSGHKHLKTTDQNLDLEEHLFILDMKDNWTIFYIFLFYILMLESVTKSVRVLAFG